MATKTNKHGAYWLKLKVHSPKRYARLAKASRLKHKEKAKQRTYEWRKKNRKRYNAYARELYRLKQELITKKKKQKKRS